MYTPQNFRDDVIGKRFDIDGYYGAQCWDGYAYYMKVLGYAFANCTTSGYVKDIWTNRATNGMLNSCDEVSVLQQGDIVVFKEVPGWTPYSHVAIFMKDLGNGRGLFLGQNQGGAGGAFNEMEFPYSATYDTSFRPKCYANLFAKPSVGQGVATLNEVPSDFIYESATFQCAVDKINIRRAPSLQGELTGDWYENGMSVVYDGYVRREGYVWISWVSSKTGNRHWMACGELTGNVNTTPYGTFK